MPEKRDRGVLASTECIQQLKAAQARQRNAKGKVWTLTDVAIESGVDTKTVSRFLNKKSKVDETTAIASRLAQFQGWGEDRSCRVLKEIDSL
jgi:hypothetical protein